MSRQEWADLLELPKEQRDYFRDDEAVSASKVAVPTLRSLQLSGAISSIKVPAMKGGYLRLWHIKDTCKASIAYFINRNTGIDYRSTADIIKSINAWDSVLRFSYRLWTDTEGIISAYREDLYLDIVVGKFVLLRTQNIFLQRELFGIEKERSPIGVLSTTEGATAKRFTPISALEDDDLNHLHRYAEYMHKNYPTMSSINIDIAAACSFLRLRGYQPSYYYE